ncbi:ATP-dependent DNA helicase [Xylanimonas oleitrophica]|uniref:ATP-dependent helicase DinG n=1 Tax=Xylanimonas oleitrophica TaxID=2607479 RepID=A0A2W5Y9P7_9MICO|nr:ATP-dependent DNA helicase [Xylanimonas oleitrophica]PZR55424.1 ATP-dependent DNA helicase [Xylanimonas oleitrophica]
MSAAELRADGAAAAAGGPGAQGGDVPEVDELLDLAVGRLGGSPREGQRRMAQEVADAVATGRHLLVQAGTGTGKSLGYLVPAVRHAVVADERVVVSTATLALQRQVITRDLPLVAEAVAPRLPRQPKIALLKGWHNYLCVHKTGGGYPVDDATLFDLPGENAAEHPAEGRARREDGAASLADHVRRLHAWAQETDTGDRDDLVPGVPDRAWRQVSVTSLECLGQKCPMLAECFPEQARAAAREADVVVTNHAMLGIAVSGNPNVLPEHDVVVVDEAHELAERVTAAATVDLSLTSVEHAARLARRHAGTETTQLDAAAQAFGSLLAQVPAERFPLGLPEDLRTAVGAVRDAARELLTRVKPESGQTKDTQPDPGAKMAQSAVLQLFEVAERMAAEDTSADVLWCSRPDASTPWGDGVSRLHAAPLAVAGLIRTGLLAEATGVFTSATLTLGGRFDTVAGSLGLGRGAPAASAAPSGATPSGASGNADSEAADWRGLDVGSPFDYPRQGILYVARHLPAPGREPTTEAQLDEIAELIEAAGGRTLGLFSSRRAALAAAEAMRDRLDVPVLAQGDDQLPSLVRQFAEDPATCLFGTLSLWQGVDVPGPSCQLVLIDRIPFPRPDDPIKAARARAVEQAGGNGFMQVSATHAALLLAQGAGRLVRSAGDRGVVAVLDPRLATARYGTFLTRSMPDFWPTSDPAVVRSALRRLDVGP